MALTRWRLSVVPVRAAFAAAIELVDAGVEEGQVEVELAGEVLVEDGLGDAGMLGDLIHRGGVVAGGGEDLEGGREDLLASLLAGQSRRARALGRASRAHPTSR